MSEDSEPASVPAPAYPQPDPAESAPAYVPPAPAQGAPAEPGYTAPYAPPAEPAYAPPVEPVYAAPLEPAYAASAPAAAPRPSGGGFGRLLVAALLGGIVGAAAVGGALMAYTVYLAPKPATRSTVPTATAPTTPVVSRESQDIEAVASKVVPSVVNVAVTAVSAGPFGNTSSTGVGSGIIVRPNGYILTNNHVIENASEITVRLGTEDLKAKVVGTDPSSDLAVIKVEKTGLPAATLGNSTALKVGQTVIAVGSPFGLDKTVTSGIVSALHRSNLTESGLAAYTNLIQTDASINPGNSGGALVDLSGAVVGINTLIQSNSGQSAGIGFAIPIDYAKGIAEQLIAGRTPQHPFLGISGVTVDPAFAEQYQLTVNAGALVQSVVPGSPADTSGLKAGDIIVKLDGSSVGTFEELLAAIRSASIGKTVAVEIVRDGKPLRLQATLGSDQTK